LEEITGGATPFPATKPVARDVLKALDLWPVPRKGLVAPAGGGLSSARATKMGGMEETPTPTESSLVDTLADRAPLAIALIGFLALCAAVVQLVVLRRRAREDRTYAYFRRYVDWDFSRHVSAAIDHARWGNLKALTQVQRDELMLVANFFDELAAHFVRRRLDRRLTAEHFGPLSAHYYKRFAWFVREFQTRDPKAFVEWEKMNEELKSGDGADDTALKIVQRTLWRASL
jgi:hypothetical protein